MASARSRSSGLRQAQEFAAEIFNDPTYKQNLKSRARDGELAPQVEVALMHYCWGKPVEVIGREDELDLTSLSIDDLQKLASDIQEYLRVIAKEEQNVADMDPVTGLVQ